MVVTECAQQLIYYTSTTVCNTNSMRLYSMYHKEVIRTIRSPLTNVDNDVKLLCALVSYNFRNLEWILRFSSHQVRKTPHLTHLP